MLNIDNQVNYWVNGANESLVTTEILMGSNRMLHSLFFCHLAIEKAMKAHVVRATNEIAPCSHNLTILSEKANLTFSEAVEDFLGILMKYQLEGRYPDYNPRIPEDIIMNDYLIKTKKLLQWIVEKL